MKHTKNVPYVFIAPYGILFVLFFVFPFFYALYLSFFMQHGPSNFFVGLQNYERVFADGNFWSGVVRVFYYGIVQVTIMLILALAFALFLDSPLVKGKAFFRLVYFLPYAVPGVIAAIMWGFLYSPQLNPILGFITGGKLNLLSQDNVLYAIVNIAIWEWTGYNMTIYFANLTSVPLELYDAAKIDGCNEWQLATKIKLPMIRSTIIMTIVLSIIGSLQLFNEPFILSSMTSIPPAFSPNLYIYNMSFNFNNLNYSAALSIVLTIITFAVSMLFIYLTSENDSDSTAKDSHR